MASRWVAIALICFTSPLQADEAAGVKAVAVEDLWRLESFGQALVSPDRQWIAYQKNVSAQAREAVYLPHFWNAARVLISPADQARPREIDRGGAVAIALFAGGKAWSPDSQRFVVRIAERSGVIATGVVETASRRLIRLPGSTPFGRAQFGWLPDGRLLYVTSNGRFSGPGPVRMLTDPRAERWQKTLEGKEPQVTVSSTSPVLSPRAAAALAPGSLSVFDPVSGKTAVLTSGDFAQITISPDGQRLAVLCLREDLRTRAAFGIYRDLIAAELCVYRIADGLTLEARSHGLLIYPGRIAWSPSSRGLLIAGRAEGDDLYDPKLYHYENERRAFRALDPPPGASLRDAGLRSFGMGMLPFGWIDGVPAAVAATVVTDSAEASNASHHHTGYGDEYEGYRFDVWSLAYPASNLTLTSGYASNVFDTQPDGPKVNFGKGPHDETSMAIIDGKRSIVIDSINGFLRDIRAGQRRLIDFRVGARTLKAWVVLPPDFDSTKRYPGLLHVYGGRTFGTEPIGSVRLDEPTPFYNANIWAAKGYVVILPEMPLQPGSRSDQPQTLADIGVAAVDAAAQAGLIDAGRVGVMGSSFGAFSAISILARAPSRFKAGVVENSAGSLHPLASWGDQQEYFGLGNIVHGGPLEEFGNAGFAEGGQAGLGQPYWRSPQAYLHHSPLFLVERILSPVMIIASDADGSLPEAQTLFAALVRVGRETALVRYWGESHAISSPANQRDEVQRIETWLNAHLSDPS